MFSEVWGDIKYYDVLGLQPLVKMPAVDGVSLDSTSLFGTRILGARRSRGISECPFQVPKWQFVS